MSKETFGPSPSMPQSYSSLNIRISLLVTFHAIRLYLL